MNGLYLLRKTIARDEGAVGNASRYRKADALSDTKQRDVGEGFTILLLVEFLHGLPHTIHR